MLWQGCTMRDAPDFPLVSVLVASYNYEPYLGMAIQSVLDQSCPHFELLIIDDGSTDGSVALAESYAAKDVRISVVRHPDGKNHGLPATLALGIALARESILPFLSLMISGSLSALHNDLAHWKTAMLALSSTP